MNNTDERVIDEMPVSRYKEKTADNYKTFTELFEVARNELPIGEYVSLRKSWSEIAYHWMPDLASWQDIEMLVGELEGLGVERSILGEVFGNEPSEERWLFD